MVPIRSGSTSALAQERMGQDHVGDGMIRPLVRHRFVHRTDRPSWWSSCIMSLPFPVRTFGHCATGVHGDRRVASTHPEPDPGLECRSSAAMHQDDSGSLLPRLQLGHADPGKDAGRFPLPGQSIEEESLLSLSMKSGRRANGWCPQHLRCEPHRSWGCGETDRLEADRSNAPRRFGVVRGVRQNCMSRKEYRKTKCERPAPVVDDQRWVNRSLLSEKSRRQTQAGASDGVGPMDYTGPARRPAGSRQSFSQDTRGMKAAPGCQGSACGSS